MADAIEQMSNHFQLTAAERNETLATGIRRIASSVGWARTDLRKAGLVERVTRGTWHITDAGRELLAERPDRLPRRFLSSRYPAHAVFTGLVAAGAPAVMPVPPGTTVSLGSALTVPEETPDETIDRAHQLLQTSLANE